MAFTPEEFARCQRGMKGPAWRVETAINMGVPPGIPSAAMGDETLLNFVKYRRLQAHDGGGAERASSAFPTIAAAERLNDDQEKIAPLKLMILADMSYDEMHARSGIDIAVLQAWESLFFDARHQRQATSWLAHQIVNRESKTGDPRFASKLKLAIMAGPVAVRGMLDMLDGICLDEADRLFQRKLTLGEKMDVAAEMSVDTDKTRMFFIKTNINLVAAEKRLALAEQKLAQRCAEARDRFELKKMRLEQAAEFAAIRLHEKQRKADARASRAAVRRQAEQELGRYQQQAMQKAGACRAAESPLAQLRWNSKPLGGCVVNLEDTATAENVADVEKKLVPFFETSECLAFDGQDERKPAEMNECLVAAAM